MARKIVIDTDPGVDDVLAILLALASPEIDVALITSVFGNANVPQTQANLIKLYYNLGRELEAHPEAKERYAGVLRSKTVVAVGEDEPIGGKKHTATYFHGPDGLSNITETHPEFNPPADVVIPYIDIVTKRAYEAILDLLRAEPEGTVTIVALGPLTNVAWAYREDPAVFRRVGEVVWMGGALDVPGNTSPVAEFNSFADPYAFDAILQAVTAGEFKFTFAPLDITTPHMISFSDLLHPALVPGADAAAAGVAPPTQLQKFTTAFLLRVRSLQAKFGNPDAMEMHDPVAVWYALHADALEANGWKVRPRDFGVERNGERTRGMCVVDRRGTGETAGNRTEDENLKSTGLDADGGLNGGDHKNCPDLGDLHSPEHAHGHHTAAGRDVDLPAAEHAALPEPSLKDAHEHHHHHSKPKHLPREIVGTPGTAVLRDILLKRVFG